MSEPKIDAIRGALYTALSETDETETRRLVREALQLLVALESDLDDDSDGGLEVGGSGGRRQDPPIQRDRPPARQAKRVERRALGGGRGGPHDAHIDG
jgi:hypothetical protein